MTTLTAKNSNYNPHLDRVVLLVLLFSTIVDSFTGLMLRSGVGLPLSPSQLVKTFALGIMFYRLFTSGWGNALFAALAITVAFFYTAVHSVTVPDISVGGDWVLHLKILSLPVSFIYFRWLAITFPDMLKRWLVPVFTLNFLIIVLNILLGAVGLGYTQYADGVGSIGFFFAGNEISSLFVLVTALVMALAYKRSVGYFVLVVLLALIMGLFKATKVAMLGVVLSAIFVPLAFTLKKEDIFSAKTFRMTIGLVVLVGVLAAIGWPLLQDSGLLERWEYWYKKHDRQWLTLILSSRDHMLGLAYDAFNTRYGFWNLLFGKGYTGFFNDMAFFAGKGHIVEMDPFDVLFMYGFAGLLLLIGFFVYPIALVLRKLKDTTDAFNGIYLSLLALLLLISLLAGHVIISGMSAMFIGLFLSLIFLDKPLQRS